MKISCTTIPILPCEKPRVQFKLLLRFYSLLNLEVDDDFRLLENDLSLRFLKSHDE